MVVTEGPALSCPLQTVDQRGQELLLCLEQRHQARNHHYLNVRVQLRLRRKQVLAEREVRQHKRRVVDVKLLEAEVFETDFNPYFGFP